MQTPFTFKSAADALMGQITASAKQEFVDFAKKLLEREGVTSVKSMIEHDANGLERLETELFREAVAELRRNRSNWSGNTAMGNNFVESCIFQVCDEIIAQPKSIIYEAARQLRGE